MIRRLLVLLTGHPLSLLGTGLTTAAAVLILTFVGLDLVGLRRGPYAGLLAFVALPALFVAGLALIPLGALRARATGRRGAPLPVVDLNSRRVQRLVLTLGLASGVNLIILAVATSKAVEVMDSTEFCGGACHTVMSPWAVAHARSVHAGVACAHCHIGEAPDAPIRAKINGTRQLALVLFGGYSRPIPSPPEDQHPARTTCFACHTPERWKGDQVRTRLSYQDDDEVTPLHSALALHLGGRRNGRSTGIHWHADPEVRVRFQTDRRRSRVGEVEVTRADGTVQRFRPPAGTPPDEAPPAETPPDEALAWRVMDCVDCHNRIGHPTPPAERAVDAALADGSLPRALPGVRREALAILGEDDAAAGVGSGERLRRTYAQALAAGTVPAGLVEAAATALQRLRDRHVFPAMAVTWGTYPSQIGHAEGGGCFRCHNDEHVDESGHAISGDCALCHDVLADEEPSPDVTWSMGS